jgi:regulator of protease activity HflC (stomatin/prohibitin superfamily)
MEARSMRIDHHAYQQATRVAGVGLLVQGAMGLTLLVFGLMAGDSPMAAAALVVLLGLLPWGGLVALFHQHKLERLEALEEDELAAGRADLSSVFEREGGEIRVAARRLERMHGVFMPVLSIVVALSMVGVALFLIRLRHQVANEQAEFLLTDQRGWAVAICLGFAGVAFIISRFVAGMAKQDAWQNLRGGASAMVGIAVVTLAVAVGIVFRFFQNDTVIEAVSNALPYYLFVLAAEVALNFILNVYRPRVPGEVPRPAFDSKLLSLVAAPDNIVRTINDAVNYQFGFDITSSWGYQLLLRSVTGLAATAIGVVVLLSTLVVVEPNEQAIRTSAGALVSDEPAGSGILFKLPWPLQSAERYRVTSLRRLDLTGRQIEPPDVQLFSTDLGRLFDRELDPFIVRASEGEDLLSLVDAEIILQYRIREDGGLMDLLRFVPETRGRRASIDDRRRALRALALREVADHFSSRTLDQVLASGRLQLAAELRERIQGAFDRAEAGIDLSTVTIPLLRPHGNAARAWEEYSVAAQRRVQRVVGGEQEVNAGLAAIIGDPANAGPVIEAIEAYESRLAERGADDPETIEARRRTVSLVLEAGGEAALTLAQASSRGLIEIMDAQAQVARIEAESLPYEAAPHLYRVLEEMEVYRRRMPALSKFLLAIDPAQLDVAFELKTIDPLTSIYDALGDSGLDAAEDQ